MLENILPTYIVRVLAEKRIHAGGFNRVFLEEIVAGMWMYGRGWKPGPLPGIKGGVETMLPEVMESCSHWVEPGPGKELEFS